MGKWAGEGGWIDEWMNGWMDLMAGWMDGLMDLMVGWMDVQGLID